MYKLCDENNIEYDREDLFSVSRTITAEGKSTVKINTKTATLAQLKIIAPLLINIHGQNENQSLMNTSAHVCLLDAYGGEEISEIKKKYEIQCGAFKKLYSSLNSFSGDPKERERLTDLYNFQIDEIQTAGLYVGEDEELAEKRNILLNSEKIAEALNVAREIIKGGDYGENISVCDRIAEARASMSSITSYSPDYAEVFARIEEVSYLLEDISSELRVLSENVFFDKGQLEQTEERINTINKLKRKYGATVQEILDYEADVQNKLDELIGAEDKVKEILKQLEESNEELRTVCEDLNFTRVKTAKHLAERIMSELESLEMSKTKFEAEINFNDEVYITNIRHKRNLEEAQKSLEMVMESIENQMPEDFFSIDFVLMVDV